MGLVAHYLYVLFPVKLVVKEEAQVSKGVAMWEPVVCVE